MNKNLYYTKKYEHNFSKNFYKYICKNKTLNKDVLEFIPKEKRDWDLIAKNVTLTEDFVTKYKTELLNHPKSLQQNKTLTYDRFLLIDKDERDLILCSRNIILCEKFIKRYKYEPLIVYLCSNPTITFKLLKLYNSDKKLYRYDLICKHAKLTLKVVKQIEKNYKESTFLKYEELSSNETLTLDMIIYLGINNIHWNWCSILSNIKLTKHLLLIKFNSPNLIDDGYLFAISKNKHLTPEIIEYIGPDKLDWKEVWKNVKLSITFIKKYKKYLVLKFKWLRCNKSITFEIIEYLGNNLKWNWNLICSNINFSETYNHFKILKTSYNKYSDIKFKFLN